MLASSFIFVARRGRAAHPRQSNEGEALMYSAAHSRPTHSRTVNYSRGVRWSIRRSSISLALVLLVVIVLAYVLVEQLDLLSGLATSSGGEQVASELPGVAQEKY
jgi:hypothetical protein